MIKSSTTFRIRLTNDPTVGPEFSGSWVRWGRSGQERCLACESGVALTESETHRAGDLLIRGDAESVFRVHSASMAVVDPGTRSITIACHPSGLHPIFLRPEPDGIVAGNSLTEVAGANRIPDPVGLLEHLFWGWCIGVRTPVAGVRRLEPGQVATITVRDGGPSIEWSCVPWHSGPEAEELGTTYWAQLAGAISVPGSGPVALMMSVGWDSRTLLAALLQHLPADRVLLYSHGMVDSRELALVDAFGRKLGCRVHLEPIAPSSFDVDSMAEGFRRTGNIQFPYWHHAGRRLADLGVRQGYNGIFGELIGGRHGTTKAGSFLQRALVAVAPRLVRSQRREGIVAEGMALFETTIPSGKPWFLTSDAWRSMEPSVAIIREEARDWLERHLAVPNPTIGGLMEEFFSKHLNGQYAGEQPRSFLGLIPWSTPMASLGCIRNGVALDFSTRAQNRHHRRMLREHAPAFLTRPTAACLIPAKYPIPMQEASRALRKVLEALSPARASRLSWANFDFLRNSGRLEAIAATFGPQFIDREAVKNRVAAANSSTQGSMHSLTDMLLKITNVEWWLNPQASGGSVHSAGPARVD